MENNFTYCKACFKKVDCVIKDNVPMVGKINNIQYEYLGKEAYCKECGAISSTIQMSLNIIQKHFTTNVEKLTT